VPLTKVLRYPNTMTLEPTTNLGEIEFILMLTGLLIDVFGLFPKDQ